MKTLIFGDLMGAFGAFAFFLQFPWGWPGWVLFLAWVCFYVYGRSMKRSLNIYLQIVLGICLSIGIVLLGEHLVPILGQFGRYVAIFVLVGAMAFLIRIENLHDLTAWFFGFVVFFGTEPQLSPVAIANTLLLPLATGFILGFVVDGHVTRFVHGNSPAGHRAH